MTEVLKIKKYKSPGLKKGSSKWKNSNGQRYLEVYGTDYYTLGYLEGSELSKQIFTFKNRIGLINFKYLLKTFTYKKLIKISRNYEPFIPQIHIDEMHGIADAILELEYEDILLQNCFLDIFYGFLLPKYSKNINLRQLEVGCTSLGAITPNGPITAQNFDFPMFLKHAAAFVHVKTPQKNEFFSLRMGAQLSLPMGMNSNGLSIRVNVVKSKPTGLITLPNTVKSRIFLERFDNIEKLSDFLKNYGSTSSGNLLISDNSNLIALEVVPKGFIREDVINTVVRSNTFISHLIQKYLINKNYSKKRQTYTEMLLREKFIEKNGYMTNSDFLAILANDPIICRSNIFKPMTLAFLTEKYFGLGNPKKNTPGIVPIKKKRF
ncbi:MAG: C45 family autoproteolytic acyltransferase/hydrolase [Candidatus Hermodarchaeota archaeon]